MEHGKSHNTLRNLAKSALAVGALIFSVGGDGKADSVVPTPVPAEAAAPTDMAQPVEVGSRIVFNTPAANHDAHHEQSASLEAQDETVADSVRPSTVIVDTKVDAPAVEEPSEPVADVVALEPVEDPVLVDVGIPPVLPVENPETDEPQVLAELGEFPRVTPEIYHRFENDTVEISALGCDGLLLRGQNGDVAGFLTDRNCGFPIYENPLQFKDEVLVAPHYGAIDFRSENGLEGRATQVAFLNGGGREAILGLGQDPAALVGAYEANRVNATELPNGSAAFMSGWVETENSGGMISRERNVWPMIKIGQNNLMNLNGLEVPNVLIYAMGPSQQGAECDDTAQGSIALTAEGKSIGAFVGSVSLADADVRAQYEQTYGVNLSGVGTLCFMSARAEGEIPEVFPLVNTNTEQIRTEARAEAEAAAIADLQDETTQKSSLNGMVRINQGFGDPSAQEFIDKALFRVTEKGVLVYGYGVGDPDDVLSMFLLPNETLRFVTEAGAEASTILQTSGALSIRDEGMDFVDSAGNSLGKSLESLPPSDVPRQEYDLSFSTTGEVILTAV